MPHFGFGSATAMLSALSGYNHNLADDFDEETNEVLDFLNLEHLEADDDGLDEASASLAAQPPTSSPTKRITFAVSAVDNGCSICMTEFDEDNEAIKLKCGHVFCSDCLAIYLQVESGDFAALRHELSRVVPVKPGVISLHLRTAWGVKCPGHRCKHVLEFNDIRRFATKQVFQRFDRFILQMTLEKMEGLVHCPQKCGGYLQDDCVTCSNEDCRNRTLRKSEMAATKRKREWYRLNSRSHQLFGEYLNQAGVVKCCPTCFVIIEKNQGCDHMRCTRCNTSYLWSKAPSVRTGQCWYQ